MSELESTHVVRRTNHYWAGLGSDLVIEQTLLMRSLKSTGGLTWGSGMTEHQRAKVDWQSRARERLLCHPC